MKPVRIPNLPEGDVTAVIIDGRSEEAFKELLIKMGISVIPTLPHPDVYSAVAFHPDIMLHHIGSETIVYAPNTPLPLINEISGKGFKMIKGQTCLSSRYPGTISYNIARVGNYAFHNTKYTDPVIRDLLIERGVEIIHVNQGYTKCLTCVVDSSSIITSDLDIYKKAVKVDIDALLIEPDTSIVLEPFNMGFLGGATGLAGKNKLIVAGDLGHHKNFKEILNFLSLKAVDVVMLKGERIMDIGTIIPILQK